MPHSSIDITIKLLSDAEPGTGLGTELLNDLVPIDSKGRPFIPATHLKGLARQTWRDIAAVRGWPDWMEAHLFGMPGANGEPDRIGVLRFRDCVAKSTRASSVGTISRTRITEHGTVATGSLRTNECIRATTEFTGAVIVAANNDSLEHQAACLTLLAIEAIGGGRTRGAGRILTTISSQSNRPSAFLKKVDSLIKVAHEPIATPFSSIDTGGIQDSSELFVVTFEALSPVCCPQTPLAAGTNIISGGFYIPSSAVQGGVLTAISEIDSELGSMCFASNSFRAWPLLPCALTSEGLGDILPIYASTTHRISKIPDPATHDYRFADSVVGKYAQGAEPSNAPMKGADGVLLSGSNGVRLWRSAEMPRVFAAHVGLGGDEPALFTTQSIAPMIFRGLLSVPKSHATRLTELLGKGVMASFGRSRTVRGIGLLRCTPAAADWREYVNSIGAASGVSAFIVQSPIFVANHSGHEPAGDVLKRIVEEAGWGRVEEAHANLTCSFGWNRVASNDVVAGTRRLRAAVTIAPGSVFRLSSPPKDLPEKLVKGLGAGRERGFGAVLPHPGIARELYSGSATRLVLKSRDDAGRRAAALIEIAADSGLTASQISDLISRLEHGRDTLSKRLRDLPSNLSKRTWDRWSRVHNELEGLCALSNISDNCLLRILKGWHDYTVASSADHKEWTR